MPNVMVISWKNCQMTCKIFHVFKPNVFNKYLPCIFDFCEIQLIRIFGQRFRHPRLISPAAKLALHHEFLGLYRYDAKKKGYRLYRYTFILCVFHRKREREKRKEIHLIYIYIKIYYFCVIVYYIHVLTIFFICMHIYIYIYIYNYIHILYYITYLYIYIYYT